MNTTGNTLETIQKFAIYNITLHVCKTFVISCLAVSVYAQSAQEYYTGAKDAYKTGDYLKSYEMIAEAYKLQPYHPGILYQAGIAAAMTSKPIDAIQYLKKAINIDASVDLSNHDFKVLEEYPDFKTLKIWQKKLLETVVRSDTAFQIHDRRLHVECIAAGEATGIFYLGSIHKRKIIKAVNGVVTDFTTEAQHGLTSVFSLKIDQPKKILWACASPVKEMENYDSAARSAVYEYDLETKKLLNKYYPEHTADEFVFGDLALNKAGDVFVSDSRNNIIFKLNRESKKLETYFKSDEFWNIQGITFSDDENYIFISDYIKGIYRLGIQKKELIRVTENFQLSTKSIDGLIYYQKSLIAIQNYVMPMRVTRYFLNVDSDKLINYAIIDKGHPAFNEPTNGCIQGNYFYYIANSQWSGYNDSHQLKPDSQLQNIVILRMELGKTIQPDAEAFVK
jgi:hypothetical protein